MYNFSPNGVLYWIGTKKRTEYWQNPVELGFVEIFSSEPLKNLSTVVGRYSNMQDAVVLGRDSWICIDLKDFRVFPSKYTLKYVTVRFVFCCLKFLKNFQGLT